MDADWQRVNSYIADVLKDAHVLYAKLARLQGDFGGAELDQLQKISEAVLVLGDELSVFSKDFYDGKYRMQQSEFTYGDQGGAPIPTGGGGAQPPPAPEDRGPPPMGAGAAGGEGGEGGEGGGGKGEGEEPETYDIPVEVEEEEAEEPAEEQEQAQ